MTPDRRRIAVERLQVRFGVSQRRACRVVGQHRSTQRRPKAPMTAAEQQLREHLRDFARCHPRLGWRKAHAVAHREGLVTPSAPGDCGAMRAFSGLPSDEPSADASPMAPRRDCGPVAPTTCGRWTSSSTRPLICAASSC